MLLVCESPGQLGYQSVVSGTSHTAAQRNCVLAPPAPMGPRAVASSQDFFPLSKSPQLAGLNLDMYVTEATRESKKLSS